MKGKIIFLSCLCALNLGLKDILRISGHTSLVSRIESKKSLFCSKRYL